MKEHYQFKINMFGEENALLEKENQVLKLKAEKLKLQIYQDDLSDFERSIVSGSNLVSALDQDLDQFDNLYSDINSVIESLSINLEQ